MQYYRWILFFHIMSWMSWMAMLFYLPRLYVYHQENKDKKDFTDVVKTQERMLYKVIGMPAMWATIISGSTLLALNPILLSQSWMWAKLTVLVFLIAYSYSLEYFRKVLLTDSCTKTGQFFRAYNEVPTILAILIVVFVILKYIPIYFSVGITAFFGFIIFKILTKKSKKR